MLRENGAANRPSSTSDVAAWKARGRRAQCIATGQVVGAIALADEVRPESRQAVDALHERGVRVAMITGDAHQVADSVARELGIDEVFAEVLPRTRTRR